ncbi:MAG: c-type cytochrome [Verrucomicrobiales bacterium]
MFPPASRAILALGAAGIAILAPRPVAADPEVRPIIRQWEVADFDPVIAVGLEGYRDFENGRRGFSEASCIRCHRFAGEGPLAANTPDLTNAAGSLSPGELLEAIISPSLVIARSDVVQIFEQADGKLIEGRIVEEGETHYLISPDSRDPGQIVKVLKSTVITRRSSPTSAMPTGLLDTLNEEDILDLLAYLLSVGNKESSLFAH